jgi:ABC-type sugar transport system substrate-binding protein
MEEVKMKKLLAILMTVVMLFSLAACSGNGNSENSDNSQELVRFKIGTIDTGSTDATSAPLFEQLKLTCEALGAEYVTAAPTDMTADGYLAAVENLISVGCKGIIMNAGFVSIPKVAKLCDEAQVYWSLYWYKLEEGTEDYEAAMNSKYFVSTFYEDDTHSAYFATAQLGKQGCKNICMIGLPAGSTSNARDAGIKQACDEYGMTVLAEERDFTLTYTAAGGATIAERFLSAYPECDGIIIAGMTQFCLPGVVQTLEQTGNVGKVKVAGIDFNEYQFEYMESGALTAIIGGHFTGPTYAAILIANIINGTPLTEDKLIFEDQFIELDSAETAKKYADYMNGSGGVLYTEEEIRNCLKKINPDFTIEDLKKIADSYSVDDLVNRHK